MRICCTISDLLRTHHRQNWYPPTPDKVQAVQQAPTPKNVSELKAFLGLLNYYGKFMPNLATTLSPLYNLLRESTKWRWSDKEKQAFEAAKKLLLSSQVLTHYNPKFPLVLACDASHYGIGAVLSHRYPDGQEQPIGYASRTLSKAEQNYSQIEKERLSCVFGVKVMGNHVNEIHYFCKLLNFSRLGCLYRRRFALRFACVLEHGKS